MHYVPESSREFLPADSSAQIDQRRSVHYESAPLYLLTAAVGALLLADVFASVTGAFSATYLGYRWALLAAVLGGSRILYHTLDDLLSGRVGAGLALTIAFAAAVWLGEAMTAALVVFITLTGECVERYTIDRATPLFGMCSIFTRRRPAFRKTAGKSNVRFRNSKPGMWWSFGRANACPRMAGSWKGSRASIKAH